VTSFSGGGIGLGKAVLEIGVNDGEFRKVLDSVDKRVGVTGKNLQSVGKVLTASLTAPLIGLGATAVKFSNDFNGAMANVASLIPGNTKRVLELKGSVQELAVTVGKSTEDMAAGLYQTISAFGDTADTVKILEINAKAAAAGLATTEEAIGLTSAVTKGYGDTSAVAVQQVSDLAQLTVRLGQTTFPELASSMGRVVPIAANLKVSQEELFAVMATATGVTGNAAEVSTQLRGVMQSLMAPTEAMQGLFQKLGVESGEALIKQKGLHGAMTLIVQAAQDAGVPLQKYLGSIEGQTLALALAGPQAGTYTEKLGEMGKAAGATDAAFKEQTQGINASGFALEQWKQRAAVAAQKAGDFINSLGPVGLAIGGIASGTGPALTGLGSLWDHMGRVKTMAADLTSGIGTTLAGGLSRGAGGLKTMGAEVAALTRSIGFGTLGLVGAIGGLMVLLGELERRTRDGAREIRSFSDAADAVANAVARGLGGPVAGLGRDLDDAAAQIKKGWGDLSEWFSGQWASRVNDAFSRGTTGAGSYARAMEGAAVATQTQAAAETAAAAPRKLTEEQLKKIEEATKKANAAADKYNATQDQLIEKMRSAGIMTQEVVATGLAPLIEQLNIAARVSDQQLRVTLIKLEPELLEIAAAMRAAGMDTSFLTQMLDELRTQADALPPVISRVADDVEAAIFRGFRDPIHEAGLILKGLPPLATTNIGAVADAFETLGITSRAELQRTATEARRAYETLKASGIATADELKAAWKTVEETARAAAGETKRSWGEVFPYLKSTVEQIGAAVTGSFAQMLLGAKGFKDGFLDIWESIKAGIMRIFTEILNDFTNRFLKGILSALSGQQGGFASAFSGLFPSFGGGLIPGLGGAGNLGGIPGVTGSYTVGNLPGMAGVPWWQTGLGGGAIGGAAGGAAGWVVGDQTGNRLGSAGAGAGVGAGVGAIFGGPVGAGIGALIGAGVGWYSAMRENMRANDDRDQFFLKYAADRNQPYVGGAQAGSTFHDVAAQLTAAGHGEGGGQLFQDLINANDTEAVAKAIEAVNKALAEYAARTGAATQAEEAHSAALEGIRAQHQARINELQAQAADVQKQIADWDAREAPEEVMGAVEAAARAELAQQQQAIQTALNEQRAAMEAALAAATAAGTESAGTVGDAFGGSFRDAEEHAKAFADFLAQMGRMGAFDVEGRVRLTPEVGALGDLPSMPQVPQFSDGSDGIRDFGRGTLAMLHGREEVRTEAQARADANASTFNIYANDARSFEEMLRDPSRRRAVVVAVTDLLAARDATAMSLVGEVGRATAVARR
jgi:TP901 family phage tail tape measure protein